MIYRWELYSENLRRVVEGEEPLKIDSIINARHEAKTIEADLADLARKDSILRQNVKEEEQFDISSDRDKRNLPTEGLHFLDCSLEAGALYSLPYVRLTDIDKPLRRDYVVIVPESVRILSVSRNQGLSALPV